MKLSTLLSLGAAMALPTALAAPHRPTPQEEPHYFLRVFAPGQPFHGRHLVQLPTTGLLGLENFTVHPETPPVHVLPVKVPDQATYALKLPFSGDDHSKTPYVATIVTMATRTASIGEIIFSNPTKTSKWVAGPPSACPAGKDCVKDAFSVYQPSPADGDEVVVDDSATGDEHGKAAVLGRLSYEGFPGQWEAWKDAGKEGWHVYWKGNGPKRSERIGVLERQTPGREGLELEIVAVDGAAAY